jgi:hypothetical protein
MPPTPDPIPLPVHNPVQTAAVPPPNALDDVHGIIARAVEVARAAGRDYIGQCQSAAEAIVAVRHDVSLSEALNAVYRFREQDAA